MDTSTTAAPLATPAPRDAAVPDAIGHDAPAPEPGALRSLVAHRDLLWLLAARDVRIRYKETAMGFAWALVLPLLVLASGVVVQFALARATGRPVASTAVASLLVKAVPWAFFASALGFAANSVLANAALVTKVRFPREILPVAAVLAQATDLGVATVATVPVLALLGTPLHATAWWALPLLATLLALVTGLAMLLAVASAFFRDVKYLVQVALTYGIFFTPVFFDSSVLGPRLTFAAMCNPVSPLLEGLRLAVVRGHDLLAPLVLADGTLAWTPWYLAWSVAVAAVTIAAGLATFRRSEDLFAELL